MDWTVYWFMLPVCVVVASVAMFSGMSGAAMLVPVFMIGFPLLEVPRLSAVAAIGTALLLETSGFGTGVYRYLKLRLADVRTAAVLIAVTLPLGAAGAVAASHAPAEVLRIGYGIAMVGLAVLLLQNPPVPERTSSAVVGGSTAAAEPCGPGRERTITTASGRVYAFCADGLVVQRALSGAGAFAAGMISTGVGEATMPGLVRRSRFPVPVAAATSTVVVAGTVVGAAATHVIQLSAAGGWQGVPWNLVVWAVPGAVVGAFIGTGLQGRFPEPSTRRFFAGVFFVIGVTFLVAFTVFVRQFG